MASSRHNDTKFNIVEVKLKDLPDMNGLYMEESGFLIIDMDELPPISENLHNQFFNDKHNVLKLDFAGGMIVKKGWIKIKVNFKDIVVCENEILACKSGMFVELIDLSDDFNTTFIGYSNYSLFSEQISKQFVLFSAYLASHHSMKMSQSDIEKLIAVTQMIKTFIRDKNFIGKEEVINSCTRIIVQEAYNILINNNFDANLKSGNRKSAICQDFLKLLEKHYAESRKVSFYADKLCLSPKHLSKTVLEGTGKHITEWIEGYVLLAAQTLLRSQKYTIQEVSDKLNFANQSFFGSWFKRATGMNPSEFINKG